MNKLTSNTQSSETEEIETGETSTQSQDFLKKLKDLIEKREASIKAATDAAISKRENKRRGAWRPKKTRNQKSKR